MERNPPSEARGSCMGGRSPNVMLMIALLVPLLIERA